MKILWISRHVPKDEQRKSLEDYFRESIDFVVHPKSVRNADEIITLMRDHKCDEVVAVLPLNLFAELTEKGVEPIRAMMGRVVKPGGGADYSHIYFERIFDVKVVSKRLNAPARELTSDTKR